MRTGLGGLAVFVALSATLSGCGDLFEAPVPPEPKVREAAVAKTTYLKTADNKHAARLGGRQFSDAERGLIVGPHALMRQQSAGTVREIGARTAKLLDLPRAVRAPRGHEFVVADFTANLARYSHPTTENGHPPGDRSGHDQWVVVDEHRRKLDSDLADGGLLIVAAPVDSKVMLRVRDSGRDQYLNLRNGRRSKDAVTDIYPTKRLRAAALSRESDALEFNGYTRLSVRGKTDGVGVHGEVTSARAQLSPFNPNGKWTRKNRAWLYVTLQVSSSCAGNAIECRIKLSPDEQVRLYLKKRGRVTKVAGSAFLTIPSAEAGTDEGKATIAFRVPASTKLAVLRVSGAGPITAKVPAKKGGEPKNHDLSWQVKPEPIAIALGRR